MIVNKEKILSGNRSEFLSLLRPHFIGLNSSENEPSQQYRLEAANVLLENHAQINLWPKGLYPLILSLLEPIDEGIPVLIKAELRFSLMVLDVISQVNNLDSPLSEKLLALRPILLAASVGSGEFWINNKPLKRLFDHLYQFSLGYRNDLGKSAEPIAACIDEICQKAQAIDFSEPKLSERLLAEFDEAAAVAMSRCDKVSLRLKEGEAGAMKANVAYQAVVHFLNRLLKNKQIPEAVNRFLCHEVLNEYKLVIISEGLNAPGWIEQKRILTTLVDLYQPDTDLTTAANKTLLQQLSSEIKKQFQKVFQNSASFGDFIAKLDYDFSLLGFGQELTDLEAATLIEQVDDNAFTQQISSNVLERTKAYKEGQWFIYNDDTSQVRRVRLLLYLQDYNQMLFSNLLGQKVLSATVENVALLISTKVLTPLYSGEITKLACNYVLDKLLENHEELHESMVDGEIQRAKQLELKKKQLKMEQEKHKSAEKAKHEAEKIAALEEGEQQRIADEKRQELLEQIEKDTRRQIKISLDAMALGSWVNMFNDATQQYQRVKLAVKFNATNRFVFVDEEGAQEVDFTKDELVDCILNEKIKLLESDQFFADRLAKIVSNIRAKEQL